jgi:PIN domain nuclease of toxin-antitoxin system
LDASAVLAYLRNETGADRVMASLGMARMSSVNIVEVVQKLVEDGHADENVRGALRDLPCNVATFDEQLAVEAGFLRRTTRHLGLSLGDRACLALACRESLPVLTTDRAWAELDLGIEVVLIR